MKYILLFLFFGFSIHGYGQNDFGFQSMTIQPIDKSPNLKSNPGTFVVPPSIKNSDPKTESSSLILKKDNFRFPIQNDFINPGDVYMEKLNKVESGDNYKVLRKNQYLGDFKTKAVMVNVSYRDHQFVDGDEIRVWVNDRIVKARIRLDSDFQGFDLTLESGFNKIDFEALNQGSSGPNTAEFRVFDDKGVLISANRWNLATGFKATIIVVKE